MRANLLDRERALLAVLILATLAVAALNAALWIPFVAPLTWALTLAVVAYPVHAWMCRRIGNATASAAIASLLVTSLIAVPALYAVTAMGEEAVTFTQDLRARMTEGGGVATLVPEGSPLRRPAEWLEGQLSRGGYREQIGAGLVAAARYVASNSVFIATNALVTVFFLFYFFRDGRRFVRESRRALPLSAREAMRIAKRVNAMIRAMVMGTLLVALLQRFLGGMALAWLGIPGAVLWGGIMALAAILPIAGAALVWAPVAAYLALTGEIRDAIVLAAWGAIVIGLVDNLLKPKLVNEKIHVHTLLVFVAVLGGLLVFGATGVMLGPIVLAVGLGIADVWRTRLGTSDEARRPSG